MIFKNSSKLNRNHSKSTSKERSISKLGHPMVVRSLCIFVFSTSNTLIFTGNSRNAMIKWCIHRKDFSSRERLSVQWHEFARWRKIWSIWTQDPTQFTSIWTNCCSISNTIHLLSRSQYLDTSRKMIEFQLK